MDENCPNLCIIIDLSKAFDTVSHDLLLQSLEAIGIRSNSFKFFRKSLTDRIQSIRIDDIFSDRKDTGDSRGIILGTTPFMFPMFPSFP